MNANNKNKGEYYITNRITDSYSFSQTDKQHGYEDIQRRNVIFLLPA